MCQNSKKVTAEAATAPTLEIVETSRSIPATLMANVNGTNISIGEVAWDHVANTGSISFQIKVKNVPAKTTYKIKLLFNLSALRGYNSSDEMEGLVGAYATLYCNGTNVAQVVTPQSSTSVHIPVTKEYTKNDVIVNNTSGSVADVTLDGTYKFEGRSETSSTYQHHMETTLALSADINQISVPSAEKSTDTYVGLPISFPMYYAKGYVNISSVSGKDFYNNPISVSTADIDSSGIFIPKCAGTYTVSFDLIDSGITWMGGGTDTKTLTFTVNPKSITAPSGTVTTTYTGEEQTLYNLTKGKPNWYDSTLYTDSSIIDMNDKVTDAGSKTVTVTLKSLNYIWSDKSSNNSKDRTFTFEVNKKALEVEFEEQDGLEVAKFKDKNEIFARDKDDGEPKFTLKTKYYKEGAGSGTAVDSPTSTGNWVAIAVLEGEGSGNYSVSATKTFTTSKKQVAYPAVSGSASEEYDGTSQEFTLTGYDGDIMSYTVPAGADSFDGTTLKVTNAGTYAPVFTLKNPTMYEWKGTAPSVEITPKPVVIVSDSENKTKWEKGTATTLKFNIPTELCDGDTTVNLVATYTLNGGDEQNGTISVNGKTGTVTIGKGFAKGNYVLTVKTAEGENYSGSVTHSFEVTAKGLSLGSNDIKWSIDGKTYVTADYDDGNAVYEMEYTGKPLNLSNVKVDFSSASDAPYLQQDGDLTGTFIGAVNKGEYTATFKIKAKDGDQNTCSDGPFTITIKIVSQKLDFSKAEWEYSNDNGKTWNKITATNKPSYTGDPISIRISPDYMKGLGLDVSKGDYTETYTPLNDPTEQGSKTTNVELTINNANYTTADSSGYAAMPYDWEITAKALTYNWNGTQAVEVGENAFEFPAVKFDDGSDYSDYYDYIYTVNDTDYTLDELKAYIADNWSETSSVSGTVRVQMKDGVTEVKINSTSRSFTTGAPKTALAVEVTGSGAEYGKVDFALSVLRNDKDERARTTVEISGGTLPEAKSFDGNAPELVAFVNGLDVGKYTISVSLKASSEASYVLTKNAFDFEVVVRKIIVPQVTKDIVFNGGYINIVDYLDSNYNAGIMSMLSGYTNKTVGSYTVTFKLNNSNYMWVEPTSAEPASKLLAKALFKNEISIDNSALKATLDWSIGKIVLATDGWNLKSKTGASLNALAAYQNMITANSLDVNIGYRYYDTNGNLIEEPVLKGGDKYIVEAYLVGEDAANFEFADGTDELKSVSARKDYTVPQSAAAAFFGSALSFAKANLLWLVIAVVVLILLITIIALAARSAKRKREREERRLAEEKAERERREEERREREEQRRREDREERMARMSQQQAMPQYIPQPMPQPQYMPQSMPQNAQSAPAGGGSMDGSQFALIQAELAAIKAEQSAAKELAAMRAEQSAARELAELKAQQAAKEQAEKSRLEAQVANMETRMGGEHISGINMDAMTEIMTRALKNVLASAAQPVVTAPPAQPAQLTDGGSSTATANAVYPPDAVMTTVTTTKIDTTKKPAQNAPQAAPAGRTIVRNFVAPMPVDDGRVFDVGGFYKPADPATDLDFGEEEKKDL